jgi:hypothetical protein
MKMFLCVFAIMLLGCDACKCAPRYLSHPPTPDPQVISERAMGTDIFTRDTTVRNAPEAILKVFRLLRVTPNGTDLEVYSTPCRGEYTGMMHLVVRFKDEQATLRPGDMLLQGVRSSDQRLISKTHGNADPPGMVRPLTIGEMREWRDCDWGMHAAPDRHEIIEGLRAGLNVNFNAGNVAEDHGFARAMWYRWGHDGEAVLQERTGRWVMTCRTEAQLTALAMERDCGVPPAIAVRLEAVF